MVKTLLEGAVWLVAVLVIWLAPPPWKYAGYALMVVAVGIAFSAYLDSRRRVRESEAAVAEAKRKLDELRNKE